MNEKEIKDYKALKEFWDKTLGSAKPAPIKERWIRSRNVNDAFKKCLSKGCHVLDYGCGSGWGIFEMANACELGFGLGIDTSGNAIKDCIETAKLSGFDNLEFECGDQKVLVAYPNYFDFIWTINTLDVLPDEVVAEIIVSLKKAAKNGAYVFVGLNPDFSHRFLTTKINMNQEGHYYYKDGILRANKKSVSQWQKILSDEFEVIKSFRFALLPQERKYPRVGFLLRNSK